MARPDLQTIHFFSQLVYLDTVPGMGEATVKAIADYYLYDAIGSLYLKTRFGGIPKEYEQWLRMLRVDAAPLYSWVVEDVFDDNAPARTGFYGCTYVGGEGERIVAFRGSELLGNRNYRNDYMTDLALAYMLPTPQQSKVDEYWTRFGRRRYDDSLVVAGHSLGGNLAVYGAIMAPKAVRAQLDGCYAFNAPGFSDEFIERSGEALVELNGRIFLYQNSDDLVSSLLHQVTAPIVVASKFKPKDAEEPEAADILYPHSNFMYATDENGAFIPEPGGEKCRFCNMVHILSDLILLLPKSVRKDLADVTLKALYGVQPPEKARRNLMEAILKYISHSEMLDDADLAGGVAIAAAAGRLGDERVPELYREATKPGTRIGLASLARTLSVLLELEAAMSV